MSLLIAPSILASDHAQLGAEIAAVDHAGADWIHVDVMDGHFVPNLTFGTPVIRAIRAATQKPFDVHLMIETPEHSLDQYIEAGADWLTVHAEATVHLHRTLGRIAELGAKVGVSLNPATPLNVLEYVLPMVDMVLLMSVNPGFGGQRFIPEVLPKIRQLRQMIDGIGKDIRIQVDGGITPQTVGPVCEAGADVVVAGSAVFGKSDYAAAIRALRDGADLTR